jgi:hypothetical protein
MLAPRRSPRGTVAFTPRHGAHRAAAEAPGSHREQP